MRVRLPLNWRTKNVVGSLHALRTTSCSTTPLAHAIRPQAGRIAAIIDSIGKAREGDTIALDFSAAGVAVGFNGEARGTVAGEGFGKALLRVWLGDRPADAALKKALLGG